MKFDSNPADNIESYFPLVGSIVSRLLPCIIALGIEYEDAFQIGCLGLTKALKAYDPAKGAFSTIATMAIEYELKDSFRYYNRKSRRGCNKHVSLDADILEGSRDTHSMFHGSPDNVELKAITPIMMDVMASRFKGKRLAIFNLIRYQGATSSEVQKAFNLTNGALHCDLRSIRTTARELWFGLEKKKAAH